MNIAVTWPKKSRSLQSYLDELAKAVQRGEEINYRVRNPPGKCFEGDRCFMVYDGLVRGWNVIKDVRYRNDVIDPVTGGPMRPGWFVVRDPLWHPLERRYPMAGFQGFRYVAAGLSGREEPV